jgi:hypothetical protein
MTARMLSLPREEVMRRQKELSSSIALTLLVAFVGVHCRAAEPDGDAKAANSFLAAHCVRCHGKKNPEGNVSLLNLSADSKTTQDIEIWKRVYEQLDNRQMPPPDSKQPPSAERQLAIASIKSNLKSAGVKFDELKELLPSRGNWVNHDLLFSGNAMGGAGTPSRIWRLSPESYKQFFIRLDQQFSLDLLSRGQDFKAPWNLTRKWEFTDFSSLHRISGAEYEHHLRNCTAFAKKIAASANRSVSLKTFAKALSAGKAATPEQLQAAVAESYEVLLRLPLDPTARRAQGEHLAKLLESMDAPSAGEQFLISVLCHPEVLYRIERPEGDEKRGPMPPRHTARAIAFTLTDREPDPILWQAAVEGKLGAQEEVRKHVTRILKDPAIPTPRVLGFFQEYFAYTTAPDIAKCTAIVNEYQLSHNGGCEFQNGYAGRFVADTDRLVEWVMEADTDVLRTLLTTRKSFWRGHAPAAFHKRLPAVYDQVKREAMNKAVKEGKPVDEAKLNEDKLKKRDELFRGEFLGDGADGMRRDIYGLQRLDPERHWADVMFQLRGRPLLYSKPRTPSPDIDDWLAGKPYDVHPEERIGILTQASWLVSMGSNFDNHVIHRGRWIRERLLGGRILEVPITVNAMLPDEPHRGLRDRMRVTREEYCWKCHVKVDPLGFPFEQYDHFGRFREREIVVDKEKTDKDRAKNPLHSRTMTTIPIDTTGAITDSGDPKLDGPVKGPFDLMEKLAQSERVEQVFVRHVFRYFLGRNETLTDGPTLVAAHKAYRESNGSFKALLVSLLSSDSFLYRIQPAKD